MVAIKSSHLIIREITLNDLNDIHLLHSLPQTDQYNTLGIPKDKSETKILVTDWINSQDEFPRKKYVMLIEHDERVFVGLIGINLGKLNYHNAEIWYKMHPTQWNKGYATAAIKSVLAFCFTTLKLHRVSSGCATENIASVKVLEKSGFLREGLCRKILPIRGEWIDNYQYAILEEDFFHEKK